MATTISTAESSNKLKRKASDELLQSKNKKPTKNDKNGQATGSSAVVNHDESSSSSTTSGATKSSKTAAIIAAATAAKPSTTQPVPAKSNSIITEEEVRRYLSRKSMTSKELLQKFKGKTQNTMSNPQLVESLRVILDKLKCKMIDQNGVKYLSLP